VLHCDFFHHESQLKSPRREHVFSHVSRGTGSKRANILRLILHVVLYVYENWEGEGRRVFEDMDREEKA
jgi:hypothetical protein